MTTTSSTMSTSGSSIVSALGSGSGVDTAALVTSLVDAQFALKTQQLTAKADALTTQISAVAKLKSGITDFDAALRTLVKNGTVSTQPTSSNETAVKVAALPGAAVGSLSGSLKVTQLAGAQAATTNTAVARTAAFRPGTLSLRFGTETTAGGKTTFTAGSAPAIAITIGNADATLDGIAKQINAANAGVTATVVDDGTGARLTIKGATGAAQAFTLTGTDTSNKAPGLSLSTLNVSRTATGTTIGTSAADAIVVLNGAIFKRPSNTITNLVSGVKLDLVAAGTATLGTTPPTAELGQAVANFVETFNQLQAIVKEDVDPVSGILKTDTTVSMMARSLGRLTTSVLDASAPAGAPRTLADLGVTTNRDGTLSVDQTRLNKVLTSQPGAVEKLFAYGTGKPTDGIAGALGAIAAQVTNKTYGLDASTARYTKAQTAISDQQTRASEDAAAMKTRLTAQFAKMDAIVAQYKSTQSFLKSQVDAWNKSDG